MNLYWKVRVASKVSVSLSLVFFISFSVLSQSINHSSISLSENGTPFHHVAQKISDATGLNFIYSSNKVQINSKIFIHVSNKPVDDVLQVLANNLNVSMKRRGNYVIIKPLAKNVKLISTSSFQTRAIKKVQPPFLTKETTVVTSSISRATLLPAMATQPDPASIAYLKRNLSVLTQYFDTTHLKNLDATELKKINLHNRHRGLFVSGGVRMNDFSAGLDIQAGIRSVYLILQPGLRSDKTFHGAYGLGTTLLLTNNLSFAPAYTYSAWARTNTMQFNLLNNTLVEELHTSSRQHQLKFLFQYSFTDNLILRFGPVMNQMSTKYKLTTEGFMQYLPAQPATTGSEVYKSPINIYSTDQLPTEAIAVPLRTYDLQPLKMWLGWEASFSYKFNFYKKK